MAEGREIKTIAVIGAGTMGLGIAHFFATAGFKTFIYDASAAAIDKALLHLNEQLSNAVSKGKITKAASDNIESNVIAAGDLREIQADLIIEAVVENLDVKKKLFKEIESIDNGNAILATNTSSLSITQLSGDLKNPGLFLGAHFFNPATVMNLVEIVSGNKTESGTMDAVRKLLIGAGKTVVTCTDSPGFIVNRVARHFYLESLRALEENAAQAPEIDALLRSAGFRMGPFELMDLIGIDINYAVSKSIYEAFDEDRRFKPSVIQMQKITEGALGRKTGKGFYDYPLK